MEPSAWTVPAWQRAQEVTPPATDGWDDEGGRPWQVPQVACVPSTRFHAGAVLVPPPAAEPWQ